MEALLAAQKLLGCFRQGDANDPVVYGSAIAAVLSEYPREVVMYVCHPFTGLPSTNTFMPSVFEVKAACDERSSWLAKLEKHRNWGNSTIEARKVAIAVPKEVRPTRAELIEKYGKGFGLDEEPPQLLSASPAFTPVTLSDHYAVYRLGFVKRTPSKTGSSVVKPAWDGATRSTVTKMLTLNRLANWIIARLSRI